MSPRQIPPVPGAGPVPSAGPARPGDAADLAGSGNLEPAVLALLDAVPEFGPTYLALVAAFDDDPGGPVVFTELAEFVADRLDALEGELPVLLRALAAVEAVAGLGGAAGDLVAYAFLDSLSPDERRIIGPLLGEATRSLFDELEVGT